MDDKTLLLLANRSRAKFRGRYPSGITAADCFNDAVVLLLELEKEANTRKPPDVNLDAWLVTRCHGDLRDRYARLWKRENQIRIVGSVDGESASWRTPGPVESIERAIDIHAAIDKLKPLERKVTLLSLQGLTQDDIAKIIGHTQPSVSQILARARAALAPLLASYGELE